MTIRDGGISAGTQVTRDQERARAIADATSFVEMGPANERRFSELCKRFMSPIYLTDLDYHIIAVNGAFCDLVGRTREELVGIDSMALTHADDIHVTEEVRQRPTYTEIELPLITKRIVHKDGRTIAVESSRTMARDDEGAPLYFIIAMRDVTERVKRDRFLRLVVMINHLAVDAIDEVSFNQKLCQALVDDGGYALAWVGMTRTGEQGDVELLCAAGATDYLDSVVESGMQSALERQGPLRTALRTGISQVINDQSRHEKFSPWTERATRFGFQSLVVIPDRLGDIRAALVLYHRDVYEFDDVTVKSLEAIVREVEFAITHIRAVQQLEVTLEEITVGVESLRSSERSLSDSEERFRLAFENNMAPMVFSDIDDHAIAMNDAFCDMLGFSREELMGRDSRHFTHPEDIGITERSHVQLLSEEIDQVRYIKRYLRRDGRVIVSEVSRSTARDSKGKILYFVASERDVTAERALNEELSHKALHDSLTGLANRALFEDRLAQAHERAVRHGGTCAVLMLDLDDFRGVNETHGHVVGDHLLVAIARRFEEVTRSTDTICRFGGDEFLYLAEGLASEADVDEVAARLLGALSEPFVIDGKIIKQSASVGTVAWDGSVRQTDELLQNVDVALYESKRHRRGKHVRFDPTMHQLATSRFELLQELRHALEVGDISMHYQPIVDLSSTKVVGFEALMRWEHPERGPIPPLVFIPLAEQSDLIVDLGWFALREAVAAASSWGSLESQGGAPYVTVNLSAQQFHDPRLVGVIEQALDTSGLLPQRLIIEITESVTQYDIDETIGTIGQLNELGVSFALDDFGTGYSSLSYLALLKPLIIKIDKSFINPAIESEQHDVLLGSIIQLGDRLGKVMLAEGIETRENLEHVRGLGCKLGQGYLFSRAVPCADAARMVGRTFEDLVEVTIADGR